MLILALWILAFAVYGLKFVSSDWNEFTKFGKVGNRVYNIPSIDNRLGWIAFYGFSCTMLVLLIVVGMRPTTGNYMLFIHSFRRLLESLFITKFTPRRMHIINFMAGLAFYFLVPVSLMLTNRPSSCTLVVFACIILNILQFYVHFTLSRLVKYTIPQGIMFKYSTSPHYLIEILLYLMYFVLSPSLYSLLAFVFALMNLVHMSRMSYRWYTEKFGDEFVSLKRPPLFSLLMTW